MNDIDMIEMDATAYATRGAQEQPGFMLKAPPCDGCEHATRCASESLACCEFARYVGALGSHTTRVRAPSAAWYAFAEGDGPLPKCQCRGRTPTNRNAAGMILQALKDAPGSTTLALGNAVGVSRKAAKSALGRMRDSGLVQITGYVSEGGHRHATWAPQGAAA